MSEYIDKTEMLIRLKCLEPKKDDFRDDDCFQAAESQHDMICEYLKPMQPADVAPVVHAHWKRKSQRIINKETGAVQAHYIWNECSLCKKHNQSKTDFCPYCGAKMDESEDTE